MQRRNRKLYVALTLWACVLAFGIGVELSHAAALDEECGAVCDDECESHGGCGYELQFGCDCYWICEDGDEGVSFCAE